MTSHFVYIRITTAMVEITIQRVSVTMIAAFRLGG